MGGLTLRYYVAGDGSALIFRLVTAVNDGQAGVLWHLDRLLGG